MKVALVYDRINKFGGAERVLLALHEIWPEAPLFTAVFDTEKASWSDVFKKIIPSFLQKIPLAKTTHEFFPWLTPLAFQSFDFNNYDVVISVTSAEAKFIKTSPKQLHICYCLTPTRYLWSGYFNYWQNPGFGKINFLAKWAFWSFAPLLRMKDQLAAQKPDYFLAISKEVQKRIWKYYQRRSEIIYPPVEINGFKKPACRQGRFKKFKGLKNKFGEKSYFLVVSRLVAYKNVDLIVKAFNDLGWPLKIVGVGRELDYLKKMARKNIDFLEKVSNEELAEYYQNCQALIMSAEEDFGLTALEAQTAGKPVIAYKKGGALETVIDGKTGLFFENLDSGDLKLALIKFKRLKFKPSACINNAEHFSKAIFIKKFKAFVEDKWQQNHQGK